jgi:hypothetical protein
MVRPWEKPVKLAQPWTLSRKLHAAWQAALYVPWMGLWIYILVISVVQDGLTGWTPFWFAMLVFGHVTAFLTILMFETFAGMAIDSFRRIVLGLPPVTDALPGYRREAPDQLDDPAAAGRLSRELPKPLRRLGLHQ